MRHIAYMIMIFNTGNADNVLLLHINSGTKMGNLMIKTCLLSGSCALLLATVAPALAAEDTGTNLETVVVNAYRTADYIEGSTKTDTPLIETPQSVSVVTRDEMDARGVTNLNEALRYDAGVLSESQGIDNRVDDFYIRGFDAGSWGDNVTLDGMRAPQGSQWNRTAYDSWDMERVEVMKGPSAVLYGQVAPGGMVNQVTKKPVAHQMQQLRVGVNSFGQYQAAIDVGTALTPDNSVETRLVALYRNGHTQLDHVNQQHWFIAPSVTYAYDTATDLTLQGFVQRDQGGSTFQFLPYEGTVTKGAEGYIKNSTFLGEPKWNTYDRTIWNAAWQFRHAFSDAWTFRQNGRFDHTGSLYRATVAGGALTNDRVLPRRAVQGTGTSSGLSLDTRIEGHVSVGAVQNTLLIGTDWHKDNWHGLRQAAKVSSTTIAIDVYNPVYTNYDFASVLVAQISQDGDDSQLGAYLQDQIAWGGWRITLSGRHDWFADHTRDRLTGEWSNVSDNAFTGRAGVLYAFDNGFSPYFSYAESFQPASYTPGDNYDDKAFDPVTGKQYELGLKYQPKSINAMITLSEYKLYQQNVATADPDESHDCGSGAGSCYVETGEVRVRGIELEGRLTPVTGLSLIGSLTHMDSEITKANDGTQGNDMKRVPQWSANAWVDYTFLSGLLKGLSLAGGTRYTDTTYGNTANTLKINGYTLWDAALRYDLSAYIPASFGLSKAQFAVNGNNLADKRYVATCTATTACYYGSGRTINITLNMGW